MLVFILTPVLTLHLTTLLQLPPALAIIPTALFQQLYSVHNLPHLYTTEILPSLGHATITFAYLIIGILAPSILTSMANSPPNPSDLDTGVYLQAVTVFGAAQMVWQYGGIERYILKKVIFDRFTSGYNELSWCVMDSNYTAGIAAFTVAFGLGVRERADELVVVIIGQILWAVLIGQVGGVFRLRFNFPVKMAKGRKGGEGKAAESGGSLSIKIDQDIQVQVGQRS